MNSPIVISQLVTASTTDLLSGTRLSTAPGPGIMTFEFAADLADATNNFEVTLTLPNGDNPMNGVVVPANESGVGGILDDRTKLMASYPVRTGGKFQIALTETGTAELIYRITWRGAA